MSDGFFRSRWVDAPDARRASSTPTALPAGLPRRGRRGRASSRRGSTWACSSRDERGHRVRGALHDQRARGRAGDRLEARRALDRLRAVVANSGCSNVGDGERGLETARAMQARGRRGARHRAGPGRRRVDRRDRPRAAARQGARAACARRAPRSAPTPTTSRSAILTSDRGPKRACLEVQLPGRRRVRLAAQAKGAGMISPRHATMFCFIADRRRARAAETLDLLTGVCVKRSLRPHLGGRPALHQRHGLRARERRLGRAGRARVARRAARSARRSTRCCASSRSRSSPTARARGASAAIVVRGARRRRRARGALGRQLAARQDRAARRRPQLRPHPAGGRPGVAARRAVRRRPRDRGRAGGLGRRRDRDRPAPSSRSSCRATEVEYVLTLPGEGGETEVFFSDLSPGIRDLQRGVHAHERRRNPPRGAALHPRVPRQDGGDQVRRRGDDRPRAAARSSRATSCCSSTSGMNPVVVHGGGPDITSYMERLGMEVRVRRGPARVRRGHRRGGEDGAGRQAEQGHRAALNRHGQPAVGLCGDDGCLFTVQEAARRRRDRHRLRRRDRARRRGRAATTSPRTTSR